MTIRRITLAESEGMPEVIAECRKDDWNGFRVPRLTAQALAAYYGALAQADPNGTWNEVGVEFVGPEESNTENGVIVMWDDYSDDHTSWECDAFGRAWISGLCWEDADR